jgi:TolB protein
VIADLAHEQHALVGYVHPFDWVIDPAKEKSLSHTLPVDVALAKVDYLEVVSFAEPRATAEIWYRLLNLGFHLPAGAGTDAMTNYASLRGPVGLNRVYLATKDHGRDTLTKALKEGRSFVTNGPLLGLEVEGKRPGDKLQLKTGKTRIRVQAAVRSIVPVTDIELVFNGRVIERLPVDRAGRGVDFDGSVAVPGSGWLLLRASNPIPHTLIQDTIPYATTNPVWVNAGAPPPAAVEEARYFLRWVDRIIEAASARTDFNTERERAETLNYLRSARAIFEAKARAE